jgi:uncharacterized integral membrane protein
MNDRDDSHGGNGAKSGRNGVSPALIGTGVLGAAVLAFVVSNGDDVEVSFLGFDATMPTWLLIVVSLAVGALLDRVVGWWMRRRRRRDRRDS